MAEQKQNVHTNENVSETVSFSDISLGSLSKTFNDSFKVCKGSASQVVLGFNAMVNRLQEPSNEYQQSLYPRLRELSRSLYEKYANDLLQSYSNDTERQVFGANLNGNKNNGSLYRSIPSGVNRNLTYSYAQFGQLVRVLTSRLNFIINRDPSNVLRYKNSQDEFAAYQVLQTRTTDFLNHLRTVSDQWNQLVTETRTRFGVAEQQRPERSERQQQSRTERPQRNQRTPHQRSHTRQTSTSNTTRSDKWTSVKSKSRYSRD